MILCAGRRKIKILYQYSRDGAEPVTPKERLPKSAAPFVRSLTVTTRSRRISRLFAGAGDSEIPKRDSLLEIG